MSRLFNFFGLNEMARPVGSLAKTMIYALEKARQHGGDFTVKEFCAWLAEAGVENPHPSSVGVRLSKLVTGEGERPDSLHPLVVTQAGRRGPGGTGRMQYVFDGPPGKQKSSEPTKAKDDEDEIPYDDEGDEEQQAAPVKKAQMPKPPWLPKADHNGDWHEETMARLADAGFGEDSDIWPKIGRAQNDIEVAQIIGDEEVSPQLKLPITRIAKKIFSNLGKDWETGDVPEPMSASTGHGTRVYAKGAQPFKKKAAPEPTPQPSASVAEPEPEDDDYGEFIEPDEDEEPEVQQAGAANFIKPTQQTQKAKAGSVSTNSLASLMKRFTKR